MKVFVCSPYRNDDKEIVAKNVKAAQALCRQISLSGHALFAPHLLYTQFLDDGIPEEREAGINAGKAFLLLCDLMLVWDYNGITEGMAHEIEFAEANSIRVKLMSEIEITLEGYLAVIQICDKEKKSKC